MRPIATDVASVCVSVVSLLITTVSCAKTVELLETPFGAWTPGWPKKPTWAWNLQGKAQFWWRGTSRVPTHSEVGNSGCEPKLFTRWQQRYGVSLIIACLHLWVRSIDLERAWQRFAADSTCRWPAPRPRQCPGCATPLLSSQPRDRPAPDLSTGGSADRRGGEGARRLGRWKGGLSGMDTGSPAIGRSELLVPALGGLRSLPQRCRCACLQVLFIFV